MSAALAEMFKHNLWANMRLLRVCQDLDERVLDASAPGTYGRVKNTLAHIFGAEQRYVRLLTGREAEQPIREREALPDFDVMTASAEWTGKTFVEYAATADPKHILRGVRNGEPYEIPVGVVLIQVINHGTEHRAHVNTILSQNGVEPPAIDGWAYGSEAYKP